jgi:hypothetical protein
MPDDGKQQPTERQQWDNLLTELDLELNFHRESGHQLGRALYSLKLHLQKHGLDKVRTGRWERMLDERKIAKGTARDWVVKYQQAENIPLDKCFFDKEMTRVKKTRNTHKYGQNNRAVPALFATRGDTRAKVVAASEVDPDKADKSDDERTAVECVFVLTYIERLAFMDAVRKLSELRATQVMYRAVLAAANDKEDAQGVGA